MSQLKLTRRGKVVIGASVVLLSIGAATVMPAAIANTTGASTSIADPYNLPKGWTWVDQELADALAEGGAPDATERDWESCIVKYKLRHATVKCPDGYKEKW